MRGVVSVVVVLVCLLLPVPARADPDELQVVSQRQVNARLLELTATTPAIDGETGFRVLLPDGYDEHPQQRYRVLYLLHGGTSDYRWWTDEGDAQAITAGVPVIVVMPDGGQGGWYSDWLNFGFGGPPEWETYHLDQLVPWVDGHFRTDSVRVIAGLSMGGFGAMSYAARHPGLFAAAASFSGAVDLDSIPATFTVEVSPLADLRVPTAVWGLRLLDNRLWEAHNPWAIAENLRGLHLAVYTGNGQPGPYDGAALPDLTEYWIHAASVSFDERLTALGIPHTFDDYGPGTHTAPYWQRDLREELPALMAA
ncbi:esterase family protein [Amycolatopsis acidicola]|uniref:Esterase family protein n=1 Tax=Amycolatopsis acidicola TaxID=2596893 RepID=A0A5N0VCR1_9PSEU|nr:alpha/beta hydrolase family protein [Amycolatopsis acidicola]KAA9162950.1 esterase family protein [Amycolatopsis acidicola]